MTEKAIVARDGRTESEYEYRVGFSLKTYIAVAIAVRNHLFPFRTEKLSSPSPMVLTHQLGE